VSKLVSKLVSKFKSREKHVKIGSPVVCKGDLDQEKA